MSSLRAAFLTSYTGLGGGETSLLALLGALDQDQLAPIVVCPRDGPLPNEARRLGVEVRIAPWRASSTWFVPALAARSRSAAAVQTTLGVIEPDVVYSDFHTLPYAAPAAAALGCPLIFGCYGWWFRPRPWQRGFYRRARWRIHAISEAVKRGFLGDPPFMHPARVEVVPLGVETTVFKPRSDVRTAIRRALGLPEHGQLVTLLARFQRVKGHDVFVDAAVRVLDELPETEFAIAGENVFSVAADERFKRRIARRVAADPRLCARIHLLGWVERSELLLAASDVVVCSSRFESFGMVHLEALACGVPVVSTNRGGPAETITDGETGFLVPPGRPAAIAARVVTLLRDETLRRRMGAAGRADVQARFTVERYAARSPTLLDSAATGRAMKILFVSRCLPLPRYLGDRLILFHLLRGLRSRGHRCGVVALARPDDDATIRAECSGMADGLDAIAEGPRSAASYLLRLASPFPTAAERCWQPDMWRAVTRRLRTGGADVVHFLGGIQVYEHRDAARGWPRLIQPYESFTWWLTRAILAAHTSRERAALRLRRLAARSFERRIYCGFDRVVLNAAPDERCLRSFRPDLPTAVIPQGVDLTPSPVGLEHRKGAGLVFVGNFAYRPNIDAARCLVSEILPMVRAHVPTATLALVGAEPPTAVRRLQGDGVEVTGTVPEVLPWLGGARVFVSPLAWGAGMKNKVLEAMAAGTPVVATPVSCDGIDLVDGEHALVATTAPALAEAVVRVLSDADARRSAGAVGTPAGRGPLSVVDCPRPIRGALRRPGVVRRRRPGRMTTRRRFAGAAAAIVLAGAAARVAVLLALDPTTWVAGSDSTFYLAQGWLLAHGEAPLFTTVSPGYTWLIALVWGLFPTTPMPDSSGSAPVVLLTIIRVVQIGCSLGMVVAATGYACRLSGRDRAALVTCAGLALGPAFVLEPFRILTETLFLALLALGLLLWSTSRRGLSPALIAAGLVFGAAALVRPVVLGLPVVLAAWEWFQGFGLLRRRRAAIFLLAVAVMLVPWSVSLRLRTGSWTPPGLSSNLWIGAVGDGTWHGRDATDALRQRFAGGSEDYFGETLGQIRRTPGRWLQIRIRNLGEALAQPHFVSQIPGPSTRRALASWWRGGRDPGSLVALLTAPPVVLKIALYGAHWFALTAGLAGLIRWRSRWRELTPLWACILYFPCVHFFLTALPRYLLPMQPALWIAVALLFQPPADSSPTTSAPAMDSGR